MLDVRLIPLSEQDLLPYTPTEKKDVAARLFRKGRWYEGLLASVKFKGENISIRFARFARIQNALPPEFIAQQNESFPPSDIVEQGSITDDDRPFILENVQKIHEEDTPEGILIVINDSDVMFLSQNDDDVKQVERLIK